MSAATSEVLARSLPSRKAVIAVAAAAIVAALGAGWIALPKRSVSTDNAYLQADVSQIAPKVAGLVAAVLVQHNQRVVRGQPLVRIDPEEFDARVAAAQADLRNALAAGQAARAALASQDADEAVARAGVHTAETTIASAEAQRVQAQADRKRFEDLGAKQLVSQQDVEHYRTAEVSADSSASQLRATWQAARDQLALTRSKRDTLRANIAQADANVAQMQAALDLALQDQRNSVVHSPIDGVAGDRQVEPGDYVQPGTRLLDVVPLDEALYVIANFKETQVDRMLPGQAAEIEVDALPHTKLHGVVDSFAPGSGSQFSLLPFEPGTGNFTKIVQRVPVRIRFLPNQKGLDQLRPGLSSVVSVRLDAPSPSRTR